MASRNPVNPVGTSQSGATGLSVVADSDTTDIAIAQDGTISKKGSPPGTIKLKNNKKAKFEVDFPADKDVCVLSITVNYEKSGQTSDAAAGTIKIES